MVKKNDILNFVCKWMEIKNTILNEITQTQKYEYETCQATNRDRDRDPHRSTGLSSQGLVEQQKEGEYEQ